MPRRLSLPFILICVPLSACTTIDKFEAQSRVNPQTVALYRQGPMLTTPTCGREDMLAPEDYKLGAINLDCFYFPPAVGANGVPLGTTRVLAYQLAQGDKTARNRLASVLLKQSDDVCTVEMGKLTAREAMVNTGLSVATSALATASTIVTGDVLKSVLSGGSGLTNATRGHVNAEVYRNVLGTAVAKAIEVERGELRGNITRSFSQLPADYNVDQMIMEVNRYHQTCSFFHGLGLVMEKVARPTDATSERHRNLTGAIADIKVQVRDFDSRIAANPTDPSVAAWRTTRDQLLAQLATLTSALATLANGGVGPATGTTGTTPGTTGTAPQTTGTTGG